MSKIARSYRSFKDDSIDKSLISNESSFPSLHSHILVPVLLAVLINDFIVVKRLKSYLSLSIRSWTSSGPEGLNF